MKQRAWPFLAVGLLSLGLGAAGSKSARVQPARTQPLKVVVHLDSGDAQTNQHGLRNIANVLKAQGSKPTDIVVVAHGEAVQYFLQRNAATLGKAAEDLDRTGKVHFEVCHNTLVGNGWKDTDVFPFARIVPSGAQEVMLRQQRGYVYFKP